MSAIGARRVLFVALLGVTSVVSAGCYSSHEATGCEWEGRRYAVGEIWDVTMGHHFECRGDGEVSEVTIFWDYVDYPDAGSDAAR